MPKINTTLKFKNLQGEEIKVSGVQGGPESEILTLGSFLSEVVLMPHQDKKGFRPLKAFELAQKFYGEQAKNEVEIDKADFIQMKELVEDTKAFSKLVVAQAIIMLNTAAEKEKK